ncbi:MAG: HD domain-containing phosphohydrolase, partial [Candidatus Zixiibacteriota bacterium]
GSEALEICKQQAVALIISDQRMPGITGVEFLKQSQEISPETIRILLTGYADINATIDAINCGAIRYYFTKPWDDEILLSRIKESLELQKTTIENKRLLELTNTQNQQLKELNDNLQHKVEEQTWEIREQNKELNQSFMETIKAFSTLLELRYKEVGSHSQRVASMAKKMLSGLELDPQDFQDVVMAAYLHDIGKISLPDNILRKNPDEYGNRDKELVSKHPILGQSCVFNINGFEEIGFIIRHHHEHYDGSGYPDNLLEEKIPLGSRIIRICDAFDHNAFKDGYPDIKTLNIASGKIVQFSGSEFDPDLVKKFIDLDIAKQLYYGDTSDTFNLKPKDLKESMILGRDIYTKNGMLLLPKGAKLSQGMIKRINKIHKVDPIIDEIIVYKQSVTKKKENHVPA